MTFRLPFNGDYLPSSSVPTDLHEVKEKFYDDLDSIISAKPPYRQSYPFFSSTSMVDLVQATRPGKEE